ncbi:PAS domain-containing sensor histidine kinase [Reyranella sp. CPCC 100927]|uniref:PAS domain-containing sensor histidine kinase n=1 Tax=Reyranella sp. CPCC 100927 TaxID=2599616 RepID=UPI0011B629B6|nr:PAS domain-containing sensor histidine kinase [Reyranella sp. CPCC 100927]TWS95807.1 response regulator [Reyranella sp. CPCC 100927]
MSDSGSSRDHTTEDAARDNLDEASLSRRDRQFELLVSGVTDYALYMIDPNGIVATWNAGAQRIKGYDANEVIGQHFSRFYSDGDRAAGLPGKALAVARASGRYEAEGWRVRKDGAFFWASVIIDAIYDGDAFVGFAKITRDITERHEAQQAMERVQRQLAQSQKMDAIGQLTGGVAHDFNNLLMALGGHAATLKRLVGSDPKGRRAVEAIELATKRGASLTRQLLSFARRQRVNPTAIEIPDLFDSLSDVLASGIGRNITLRVTVPPGTWPVKVDPGELETALVNIIINARDAMPDGGVIDVVARNVAVPPDRPLKSLPEGTDLLGSFVALAIADTGTGVPEDVLPRIFEPFFSTKPVGKGTGLGLAQVHGFCHQAGGTVTIESTLGAGTTVTLYLPRAQMVAEGDADTPRGAARRVGTVLLVEDNPEVATATAGLLEQLGYDVRAVANAEDALLVLDTSAAIDLVLSDIVMPGKYDGLALARTVRKSRPGVPVVLMTGYSEATLAAADQFAVLQKPFDMGSLSRAIEDQRKRSGAGVFGTSPSS